MIDEAARLEALARYAIFDSEPEPEFDRLTALAQRTLDVPIALLTFVDATRQLLKSRQGLTRPETPRSESFCQYALGSSDVLEVPDSHLDARFRDTPLVVGPPHIRFYAGAPLVTPAGHVLGTLCAIDRVPRKLTDSQRATLVDLSKLAMEQIELRRARRAATSHIDELLTVLDHVPSGLVVFDANFRCTWANQAMGELFGLEAKQLLGWTPDDAAKHVATLAEDPDAALGQREAMRTYSNSGNVAQFVLTKPTRRVLRRQLFRLAIADRPAIAVWTDVSHEAEALATSRKEASTDALTGLSNRRAAESQLSLACAGQGPVSVVVFDVDHFKRVNDSFGHDVGDEVLVAVAQAMRGAARTNDFIARWGGEEFLAVLQTDCAGARLFAERVRLAVMALTTRAGHVTISAGLSVVRTPGDVKQADQRLYDAKRLGRNRVEG